MFAKVSRVNGGYIFHGGCNGCEAPEDNSRCPGCRYFECDWNKPDLNDGHKREAEIREQVKKDARLAAKGFKPISGAKNLLPI